jgi:hypothetical protein
MANTKKRWTADEIEILRKYYPAEGDQVCERLSGRTAKSCRIQASKMEISKNSSSSATVQNDVKYVRLWTEAEDKILREYYAAEGSKVRYRLNQRSAESCRGRAAALGLTYSGANRKWSSSEDEILHPAHIQCDIVADHSVDHDADHHDGVDDFLFLCLRHCNYSSYIRYFLQNKKQPQGVAQLVATPCGCCLTALESEVSIPQKLRSCNTPAQISALCIKSFSVLQRHFGTKRRMCCCKLYSGGAARYNGGVYT